MGGVLVQKISEDAIRAASRGDRHRDTLCIDTHSTSFVVAEAGDSFLFATVTATVQDVTTST